MRLRITVRKRNVEDGRTDGDVSISPVTGVQRGGRQKLDRSGEDL